MSFNPTAKQLDQQQILQQVFDEEDRVLQTINLGQLVPKVFDYISLSYTGSNLTGVIYKTGGSSGTIAATLILTYDGSNNLTSVSKT